MGKCIHSVTGTVVQVLTRRMSCTFCENDKLRTDLALAKEALKKIYAYAECRDGDVADICADKAREALSKIGGL